MGDGMIKISDREYQKHKSSIASRKPFAVRKSNWIFIDKTSPPICSIHHETAVWHKNNNRPSGGQWACRTCARNKSKGQRRAWKTEHTDPFTYNLKRLFTMAKCHSKKINREFSLEFSNIIDMYNAQSGLCAITGVILEHIPGDKMRNPNKLTIDRIDSSKGYTTQNTWLVCDLANRAKSNLTKEQLIRFAEGILAVKDRLL